MSKNVLDLMAFELMDLYRKGELSPVEVLDAVLARVDTLDSKLNAFQLIDKNGKYPELVDIEAEEFEDILPF